MLNQNSIMTFRIAKSDYALKSEYWTLMVRFASHSCVKTAKMDFFSEKMAKTEQDDDFQFCDYEIRNQWVRLPLSKKFKTRKNCSIPAWIPALKWQKLTFFGPQMAIF